MMGRIPVAFVAGLVSFLAPCVLPLVPGYLSAVSAVDAGRLGERGVSRRVLISSIPFVLGFTAVFVALRTGVAAPGGLLPPRPPGGVPRLRPRVQSGAGRVAVAPRPVPGDPDRRRRDPRRPRAPALLRPFLVAPRRPEPRPPGGRPFELDARRRELERAAAHDVRCGANLLQHRGDLDALVPRRVRGEPPRRLLELAPPADAAAAAGLSPRARAAD